MVDELKDAKLRIEVDPSEADSELARVEKKMRELEDRGLSPQDQRRRPSDPPPPEGAQATRTQTPSMNNTGPGRFGVRNMLSAPSLTGLVAERTADLAASSIPTTPVTAPLITGIRGAGRMVEPATGLLLTYGPLAIGIARSLPGGDLMEPAIKLASQALKAVQDLDSRLRALEPTVETVIDLAKGQLMVTGKTDPSALAELAGDFYEINRTELRRTVDVRMKTLEHLSENGGKQIFDALLKAMKP